MRKRKLWVSIFAGIMAVIMILSLVVSVLPSLVNGAQSSGALKQQLDTLKAEKAEIDAHLSELEGQLSANLTDIRAMVEQKNTIDQQIFMLHEQIANMNEQIAAYNKLIADKQEELDIAEANLAELNRKNKDRIRAMEEDGSVSYWSVLFKANNFADLLDRLNMVEEIAAADQRRLKEMSEAAQLVAQTKAELETEKEGLEQNKADLAETQKEMEEKRKEADQLLADLLATGEEYQALIDEAEAQRGDLEDDIESAQDAYDEAKHKEWLSTSVPPTSTNPSSGNAGDESVVDGIEWLVPCNYVRFTSPFGWRMHPVYNEWRFHNGVDLAGPQGTPIVASRSGVVITAKYSSSAGYYVAIDHQDGFETRYMHMTHYIVGVGDQVTAGQVIGYMGSTGVSTGSHLHFSVLYNGVQKNPADYINI